MTVRSLQAGLGGMILLVLSPVAVQAAAQAAAEEPPPAPPPAEAVSVPAQQRPNIQNPAISAVFQLTATASLSGEDEANGFDLSAVELALESVVDPYLSMSLFIGIPAAGSVEVEEAYVTTLALPAQLQLKGGRFFASFGKWNLNHSHAWPTVEKPDALTLMLGAENLAFDGLSLSYLIPNPAGLYIEIIGQAGTAAGGSPLQQRGAQPDLAGAPVALL